MAVSLEGRSLEEKKDLLRKCAMTSMNSKLVSGEKDFFADLIVDAVSKLDPSTLDLRMIGMKKVRRRTGLLSSKHGRRWQTARDHRCLSVLHRRAIE